MIAVAPRTDLTRVAAKAICAIKFRALGVVTFSSTDGRPLCACIDNSVGLLFYYPKNLGLRILLMQVSPFQKPSGPQAFRAP